MGSIERFEPVLDILGRSVGKVRGLEDKVARLEGKRNTANPRKGEPVFAEKPAEEGKYGLEGDAHPIH